MIEISLQKKKYRLKRAHDFLAQANRILKLANEWFNLAGEKGFFEIKLIKPKKEVIKKSKKE
jgi:hypothetical protein